MGSTDIEASMKRFDGLVGSIMDRLMKAFPQYTSLSAKDFDLPQGTRTPTGTYDDTPEEEYLRLTRLWLVNEGFIRGDTQFVITYQGLEVMNALPPILKPARD